MRSLLCFPVFPAVFAIISCVVGVLFIVQGKEKALLEAGKPTKERIRGSAAAILPNNLESIELRNSQVLSLLLRI